MTRGDGMQIIAPFLQQAGPACKLTTGKKLLPRQQRQSMPMLAAAVVNWEERGGGLRVWVPETADVSTLRHFNCHSRGIAADALPQCLLTLMPVHLQQQL